MAEIMMGSEKIYTILFEGQKPGEFSFNTYNLGDIEHLLDSTLMRYSKKR